MRFVIDRSVVQAPGPDHPEDERPGQCREFLFAVLDCGHRAVVTEKTLDQWHRFASRIALRWLAQMTSRDRLWLLPKHMIRPLTSAIGSLRCRQKEMKRMLEDLYLLESAVATDKIVVSLDDEVRDLYRSAAEAIEAIRRVVWVNAGRPEEGAAKWVRKGVQMETERMLGSRRRRDTAQRS